MSGKPEATFGYWYENEKTMYTLCTARNIEFIAFLETYGDVFDDSVMEMKDWEYVLKYMIKYSEVIERMRMFKMRIKEKKETWLMDLLDAFKHESVREIFMDHVHVG